MALTFIISEKGKENCTEGTASMGNIKTIPPEQKLTRFHRGCKAHTHTPYKFGDLNSVIRQEVILFHFGQSCWRRYLKLVKKKKDQYNTSCWLCNINKRNDGSRYTTPSGENWIAITKY